MVIQVSERRHLFAVPGDKLWSRTHAQVPFALRLADDRIRLFYSTRDENSCSSVCFIDVDADDPANVLYQHNAPVLSKGSPGSFDDTGTMPSWFIYHEDRLLLYYTGWNRSESASYRLSIGLAESTDHGMTFQKLFKGPILDRGPYDPIWVGQPCVMKDDGEWRMWYLNCEKIEYIDKHPEPFYNVKYARSHNGVDWIRENEVCIDFESGNTDAIGRPCVWKYKGRYWMFHSNRRARGYRSNPEASYRIVLSTSTDGLRWNRVEGFSMKKSGDDSWDGIMNEYTSVIPSAEEGVFHVFYNGNGFGASGIGHFTIRIEL